MYTSLALSDPMLEAPFRNGAQYLSVRLFAHSQRSELTEKQTIGSKVRACIIIIYIYKYKDDVHITYLLAPLSTILYMYMQHSRKSDSHKSMKTRATPE